MHFLSNHSQMNATEPFEGLANVGPGFGLVPPGNKPLTKPMLTPFSGTLMHLQGHNITVWSTFLYTESQ